jgi:RNA polymerase II subunit A-like phosphatase
VKVDTARKRGGIKIVWLAWFTDCIALWRRQDETPYLLDDPPHVVPPSSSPTTDSQQISSDPDPDGDDWDDDPGEGRDSPSLEFSEINWDDINDEVEAAMRESDEDDDDDIRSDRTGMKSDDDETNSVTRFV